MIEKGKFELFWLKENLVSPNNSVNILKTYHFYSLIHNVPKRLNANLKNQINTNCLFVTHQSNEKSWDNLRKAACK